MENGTLIVGGDLTSTPFEVVAYKLGKVIEEIYNFLYLHIFEEGGLLISSGPTIFNKRGNKSHSLTYQYTI